MTKQNNNNFNMVMAGIALLVGLYLIFLAPGFFDTTMNKLILQQTKQGTNMSAGPLSRLYVGAMYSGIEMLVGLTLVAISAALYYGKKWAWPLSMVLLSIPTMANGYIGLGWLENLKKFPPAYATFFICLIAFWAMILVKDYDKKVKNALFWVLTLIGMLGTQGFMLFPHALRVILKDPSQALLDPAVAVLGRTGPLMFFVFIFAGLSIWQLAQRKEAGWYLALLTGLMMAFGAYPAHYMRPLVASLVPADTAAPSIFTSTYWMAGAQGVLLVVLLLVPGIKNLLVSSNDKE